MKQPVRAYGLTKPEELRKSFAENGFNMRKLVVEIAVTAAAKPKPRRSRRAESLRAGGRTQPLR